MSNNTHNNASQQPLFLEAYLDGYNDGMKSDSKTPVSNPYDQETEEDRLDYLKGWQDAGIKKSK